MSGNRPTPRPSAAADAHAFRGRIGPDANHGFHPAPHRYHLYLSLSCPDSLRIALTHRLLRLGDLMPLTALPPIPAADGGYPELRAAYEASTHRFQGPATAPLLADRWTGRVVSNHAPDIECDLARHFRGESGPDLRPRGSEEAIAAVAALCEEGIAQAAQRAGQAGQGPAEREQALGVLLGALAAVEERLAARPFAAGDVLTAADVHLWVTLVQLDTVHRWHLGADAVHRIADHPRLWAYARRLLAEPAFGECLRLDEIALRHHHQCRGLEAAGAAVQIIDWTRPEPGPGRGTREPATRAFGPARRGA
ncbi:glutathione S-transferase C-terminal domain-containing protein [Streptomyces hoynatensis]|uniref:Glutathione S-transferase family protein n=1 Tax=Streptomyces hoynatensis TaxID=1141874 RepID=A0A3A9YLJ9_9ACTN|nr:glutathione S-transferase C-terminal domain-containing protein [Streptomyces hoynatensis]RKN35117.1 glutathione S-transferase family protein [Streptomyces hoynatensis]